MGRAEPNAGHRACAALDPDLLITQNVDGLHEAAGSRRLVALHGRIADVVCLSCRATSSRARAAGPARRAQPRLRRAARRGRRRDPDGDVDLDDTAVRLRRPGRARSAAACSSPTSCSSARTSPSPASSAATPPSTPWPSTGGALLVAGSSLTVMSGFRFVRHAAKAGTPVVIVNRGVTRGDDLATYKLDVGCSEFLAALVAARTGLRGVATLTVRVNPTVVTTVAGSTGARR